MGNVGRIDQSESRMSKAMRRCLAPFSKFSKSSGPFEELTRTFPDEASTYTHLRMWTFDKSINLRRM